MEESEKPRTAPATRTTLKLKAPVTRTHQPAPAPPPTAVRPQPRQPEASSWADEHKSRMQADMDALSAGYVPSGGRQRKR